MARREAEEFRDLLGEALREAGRLSHCEEALSILTHLAQAALGDPDAAERPGALKEGERDYRVAGFFAITPDRRYNMLIAGQGFPPEQRRLAIPIEWGHPGEVVRTGAPILLENTDAHGTFRQFLKTSRMGSSIYHPVVTPDGLVAQISAASQARWTYDATDLARLAVLAGAAALVFRATGGPAFLERDYPAPDLWRAEEAAFSRNEGTP